MNTDQFEGNWHKLKGAAQKNWGDLTNDDLDRINGNREKLEGEIQAKYGKSKEEAKKEVNDFIDRH
ncbi:CsbD family protein [Gilvimarinus algae]|uniref:CsbD family protein n=1 Tax=Gilvimarinus algae TaxID=3058037 RepID=A0ABT8TBX4_9GAMM|nr:CsbD family protein [Gilvimarinus sp. SDUM040014]MDO3381602.1 CsbD family protein [Gilvimarinus sp. SDUM040014]